MSSIYNEILKQYDMLNVKDVLPVAHIRIKPNIGILLDEYGNFQAATVIENERCSIPCTINSESRTLNIAPHPIHDNMSYVSNYYPKYKNRHDLYMKQLESYINEVDDRLAKSVYKYLQKNTIHDDIANLLLQQPLQEDKAMIVFATKNNRDTISKKWIEYYVHMLPKNGMCSITGEMDYIPDKYPKGIRSSSDMSKLFISNNRESDSMPVLAPGYIASQKILHTLQFMMYEGDSWAYGVLKDNIDKIPDKWKKRVEKYYSK